MEFDTHYQRYEIAATSRKMVSDFDDNGTFVEGHYKLNPINKTLALTGKKHSEVMPKRNDTLGRKHGESGTSLKNVRTNRNIFRAAEA